MSHLPKNHRLRPLYRSLAFLAGAYCLLFGIIGIARTHNAAAFTQDPYWALGLRTNLAFSILSVVVGAIVVVACVLGRNIDRNVAIVAGPVFLLIGLVMLLIMRTDANFLNFGMSTCIVSFVIGTVLLAYGLYGESAPRSAAAAEESHRHAPLDPEQTGLHY